MTKRDPSSRVGRSYAHRTLRASVTLSRRTSFLLILAGLAGSWLIVHFAGGADAMVPHWYYIPVLFAATRFGPLAALIVALLAGLLAGPLTQESVVAGTSQDALKWLTRTGFFVLIGQMTAWLVSPAVRPLSDDVVWMRREHDIRRGLARGEFFLVYQPIYSVRDHRFTGVEALIRWQHPANGELSPAHFIDVAEDSDLIHEISDFVIEEACRQAAEWKQVAEEQGRPPWHVAINLSASDLERPDLVRKISHTLEFHKLPPELLHIELTESVLAFEGAGFQLRQLKKLGIKLAIDDFGTGYSSLSYLNRFPADFLKIDQSLISNLGPDESSQALARGIVALAASLGLVTIAEGLETDEQLAIGEQLNFDFIQGYYFSRPQKAERIPVLLLQTVLVAKKRRGQILEAGESGSNS